MEFKLEDISAEGLFNIYPSAALAPDGAVLLLESGKSYPIGLPSAIMKIEGVKSCLITDKLLAVRMEKTAKAEDVKALSLAELDDFFTARKKLSPDIFTLPADEAEILKTAEFLADSFIRPTLNRDKGNIILSGLKDGVLSLKFTGHCAGCPYAQNTLNNVVANCLRHYLPCLQKIEAEE